MIKRLATVQRKRGDDANHVYEHRLIQDGFFIYEQYAPYNLSQPGSRRNFLLGIETPYLWHGGGVPDVMFVYGANGVGVHGRGAALSAKKFYGAVDGVVSPWGNSYPIVTKDDWRDKDGRLLSRIREDIQGLYRYNTRAGIGHEPVRFLVTRIGTNLAGHEDVDIAPLFADAPANFILPALWQQYLPTLAGSLRLWHNRETDGVMDRRKSYTVSGVNGTTTFEHFTKRELEKFVKDWKDTF